MTDLQRGRSRREQMCPNADCERHGERTSFMGGCGACGAQLVPYKPPEPTDDQLEGLLYAMGFSSFAFMFRRMPGGREAALNFHKLVVRGLNGDTAANERIAMLKAAAGDRPREDAA